MTAMQANHAKSERKRPRRRIGGDRSPWRESGRGYTAGSDATGHRLHKDPPWEARFWPYASQGMGHGQKYRKAVSGPILETWGGIWSGVRINTRAPQTDRFLETDPMGLHDSMNLCQAMNLNPTNFMDPMGMRIIQQYGADLIDIKKKNGKNTENKWIDSNAGFDSTNQSHLHSMLIFEAKAPREAEEESYEPNTLTVVKEPYLGVVIKYVFSRIIQLGL